MTEQYKHSPWQPKFQPKKLTVNGQNIDYFDVPAHSSEDIPVLYAPGWAQATDVIRGPVAALAESGRRVMSVSAPHGVNPDDEMEQEFSVPEQRKVTAMNALLKDRHVNKIDAIGHSEAGMYLTAAAMKHPQQFRTIVLINPAGVRETDSMQHLMTRGIKEGVVDIVKRLGSVLTNTYKPGDSKKMANLARLLGKQPNIVTPHLGHSVSEVSMLGTKNALARLPELRSKGIKIVIIQTDGDQMFPPSESGLTENHYDKIIHMPGTHNEVIKDPKQFMDAALQAIEELQSA